MEKQDLVNFFVDGGLVRILKGAVGRDEVPRAWLYQRGQGEVFHTFKESLGKLGGYPVPLYAIEQGRIFEAKQDAVVSYLIEFGLSKREAEYIIQQIGIHESSNGA